MGILQFSCLWGLIVYEANRSMAACFSGSTYSLKTALLVSWQGMVVFWADSDHLQRQMCSWATKEVFLN